MQMLDNHVVLVTGGGSGLGLGLARHFIGEGAQVAVMEISADKLADLKAEFGDDVLLVQGDVTRTEDLLACRQAVLDRFGRIDALVGAHGIFDGNIPLRDVPLDRVESLFDEVFHVDTLGYILAAKVFVDDLEKTGGAIVLTSSTAAYAADGGGLFYTAAKGAVRSVVNQLAFEFAPRVRVNGVAPSGIANSQLRGPRALGLENNKQSDIPKEDFESQFLTLALLPTLPTPEEYAPLYAYLASRANTTMTGQTIVADQGVFNRAVISNGAADRVGK
ncbi:SDR family oxidoreductase [Streptomyces cylindrosporus]|uniref:SDR family oxidoreductase n=1 Tax=Streptomyces cylindrosporus TaxID=2927583 RepID=A0ABS9Y136_9ACTN|nr:SDR family oxidoreductase [Streptomyces cylindrosporus]MCI3270734.1 SDR family oxidoreductase [Streptomyces cylindrosporus]